MHHFQDIINLFKQCFGHQYNTKLIKGIDEPLYQPAHAQQPYHAIYFAHGFFSSALHECSHWLIAGDMRRQQVDYGYWYEPDGRTPEQQRYFLHVEAKPQALEWLLSRAANYPFRLSLDNLNGEESDTELFKQAIYQQITQFCECGLTDRISLFRKALCDFYKTPPLLLLDDFNIMDL